MKRLLKMNLALAMACMSPIANGGAATSADIKKAVTAMAAYEDGKDPSGLRAIDAILRSEPSQSPALRDLERRLADLIAGQATQEAKTEACKTLCIIGGDASVAPLIKMLADEKLGEVASLALTHFPASANGPLREALNAAPGRAAVAIAALLGIRRDAGAVDALATYGGRGDPGAVDAAAMALGSIGTPEAAAALSKMRAAKPVRLTVLLGSLRCAHRLAEDGRAADADALGEQLLDPEYPLHIRRGAFLKRCQLAQGKSADLILAMLKSGQADLKSAAIAEVASIKDPSELEKILAAMPGMSSPERALLLSAFARMEPARVRPAVLESAGSRDAAVRLAALSALARVGDDASVPAIVSAMNKAADERERAIALAALRGVPGDPAGVAILTAAKASEGAQKAALIDVLADRGVAAAVPLMQAASNDSNAAVRRAALRGFAFLSGPETLGALIDMLIARVGDPSAADFERAIVILAEKIEPPSARSDLLLKTWDAKPDPAIRSALTRVLGALATDPALERLQKSAADEQPQVRDAAIRALIAWPDNRALETVEGIARSAPDEKYRVLAIRGISSMQRKDLGRFAKLLKEVLSNSPSIPVAKESLGALAQITHPVAIHTAAIKLSDPALQGDAVVTILTAAERMKPESLPSAKKQIEAALKVADDSLKPRLQALLDKMSADVSRM